MSLEILEEEIKLELEQLKLEQRARATDLMCQAWEEALIEGIDADILAEVALNVSITDMLQTTPEKKVIEALAELPKRIESGDFTPRLVLH